MAARTLKCVACTERSGKAALRNGQKTSAMHLPRALASQIAAVSTSFLLSNSLLAPMSYAVGLESVDLPSITAPDFIKDFAANATASNQNAVQAAEENFQKSPLLKKLLERTAANKDKNKQDLQNKYCYRQAEWGVGDCGGLNFVPGATQNGVQKPPEWLNGLLGQQPDNTPKIDLDKMLGPLQ